MAEAVINTSFGSKTPTDAMAMLFENIPDGARAGIFNQLVAKAPERAREVAQAVMSNPGAFGPLVDKAVKKFIGKKAQDIFPRGPRPPRDSDHLLELFGYIRPGMRLKLVFRSAALDGMAHFRRLVQWGYLALSNSETISLAAVCEGKSWGSDSNRTYQATFVRDFENNTKYVVMKLTPLLHTIELLPPAD